jgi:hypothetical protein
MTKLFTIKLTLDQLESVINLIFNNNQFSDTDKERRYWEKIINILEKAK